MTRNDQVGLRISKVVLAGQNDTVWKVVPAATNSPDGAFDVIEQKLGPEAIRDAMMPLISEHLEPSEPCEVLAEDELLGAGTTDTGATQTGERALWIAWSLGHTSTKSTEGKTEPIPAIRIMQTRGFRTPAFGTKSPISFVPLPEASKIDSTTLVVVGLDLSRPLPKKFEQFVPPRDAGAFLLYISADAPLGKDPKDWLGAYIDACFHSLADNRKIIVLVSSDFFSAIGLSLTDKSSWEAFADTLAEQGSERKRRETEQEPHSVVHSLRKCGEVIVRHGADASFRYRWGPSPADGADASPERIRELYYITDPRSWTSRGGGYLIGYNHIIACSIIDAIIRSNEPELNARVVLGIKSGIIRCTCFDERGYAKPVDPKADTGRNSESGHEPNWLNVISRKRIDEAELELVRSIRMPHRDDGLLPDGAHDWSILSELLKSKGLDKAKERGDPSGKKDPSRFRRDVQRAALRMAMDVVIKGIRPAQHVHGFPVARFGEMLVTDRQTFEDYCGIHAAIQDYLDKFARGMATPQKPLSLAVFGQPGGGKSYGMNALAAGIGGKSLETLEVNVSQFTSIGDLASVFEHVKEVSLSGKVPFVFFDEFDAEYESRAFGWLRYFLAPMQDGEFGSGLKRQKFLRAIFVFIGGLNHTFEMLNSRLLNREFIEAKGPDFVSRLARHLDVLGIDRRRADDSGYILRRALILRRKIGDLHPSLKRLTHPRDPDGYTLAVRDDVLHALLGVDQFKHGTRSLEAIVRNSQIAVNNPVFHWGSLPPQEQLEMHVSHRDLLEARALYHDLLT